MLLSALICINVGLWPVVAEARLEQLFQNWQQAQTDTRSLVVRFTATPDDPIYKTKLTFQGTLHLQRTAKGAFLGRYDVTLKEPQVKPSGLPPWANELNVWPPGADLTSHALLVEHDIYILKPAEKKAMRYSFTEQELKTTLERWNPLVRLLDKKKVLEDYHVRVVGQDRWYTYVRMVPRERKQVGWFWEVLERVDLAVENKNVDLIPNAMPRWFRVGASLPSPSFDIVSWRMSKSAEIPAETFTRPELLPGWEVIGMGDEKPVVLKKSR